MEQPEMAARGTAVGRFVGWAKRLVRRSSTSEGGSVPTTPDDDL